MEPGSATWIGWWHRKIFCCVRKYSSIFVVNIIYQRIYLLTWMKFIKNVFSCSLSLVHDSWFMITCSQNNIPMKMLKKSSWKWSYNIQFAKDVGCGVNFWLPLHLPTFWIDSHIVQICSKERCIHLWFCWEY